MIFQSERSRETVKCKKNLADQTLSLENSNVIYIEMHITLYRCNVTENGFYMEVEHGLSARSMLLFLCSHIDLKGI